MFIEELKFHETDDAFLVTVSGHDPTRDTCFFESHVFFRNEGHNFHEVTFFSSAPAPLAELASVAFAQTRRLLAPASPRLAALRTRGFVETLPERPRSRAQHPFHLLWLDKRFAPALWEIQDWTFSAELRAVLAGVTRYRAEAAEAKFISRLVGAPRSSSVSADPYGY